MRNYFRNQDDAINDPEVIQARYFVGKNLYFEVELALAEQAETDTGRSSAAATGGSTIIPVLSEIWGGPTSDDVSRGCPYELEPVWVSDIDSNLVTVPARELLKDSKVWSLYNPITKTYNDLEKAEIIPDVSLYLLETDRGGKKLVTLSHSIVKNTQDRKGTPMYNHWIKNLDAEILTIEKSSMNLFIDRIKRIQFVKTGNAIRIHLKSEHIYLAGDGEFISVDHNFKEPLL